VAISTSQSGTVRGDPVNGPSYVVRIRSEADRFRRRSVQAARRAVVHVQAAGEAAVAPDLVSWFTERGFRFYLAGLRLPGLAGIKGRNPLRPLHAAFTDLDAACAQLRTAEGIDNVIVMASAQSAAAVALWCDARPDRDADEEAEAAGCGLTLPDALIMYTPEFPVRPRLSLDIACPVLVLTGEHSRPRRRPRRPPAAAIHLGRHVTWLELTANEPDEHAYFEQLGRWLGAYMYGQRRDQLL
jgi:hypothetical protein